MSDQVQCPAPDPMHSAGVKYQGILKHIYNCRYLKKTTEKTLIYQCQYCLTHHYLSMENLEIHQKKCSLNKAPIEWREALNLLTIEPTADGKFNDVKQPPKPPKQEQKQPPKNWEFYRDLKLKKKEEKRLASLQQEQSSGTQNQSRSNSPTSAESPKQQKKVKTNQQSSEVNENSSQEISKQEKLRIQNEEKIRQNNIDELQNRIKVDDYQQISYAI